MKLKNVIPVALIAILLGSTAVYAFNGNRLLNSEATMDEVEIEGLVPESYEQALELVDLDRFRYDYRWMRFFGHHSHGGVVDSGIIKIRVG